MSFNSPPSDDEIEISVFGPGYGEAILIHLGHGEWIAIDSCVDPRDGRSVPISYLREIGIDIEEQLKLIIASHWDDDHIRGLSELLSISKAEFSMASAFADPHFIEFAIAHQSADPSPLAKSTTEIVTIIRLLKTRNQKPIWIGADRTLHSNHASGAAIQSRVSSLSPTDPVMEKFLKKIASQIPKDDTEKLRVGKLNPNEVAVALFLNLPNGAILLGADLQEIPGKSWTYILTNSKLLEQKASVFKVPHHGAQNAHCQKVWTDLLFSNVVAIVAPWNRGEKLPKESDIARILNFTGRAYATADPKAIAPIRRDPQVGRTLATMKIKLRLAQPKSGHIRLRREADETNWTVEMFGTARHLSTLNK